MKRKLRKIKNAFVKAFTVFMAVLWLVSATALDSFSNIPLIVFMVTGAYLALFIYANRDTEIEMEYDEW